MANQFTYRSIFTGLIFTIGFHTVFAQQGITNVPDTSFNFNSAFAGVKKSNPNAAIPKLNLGDSVKAAKDVVYCEVNGRLLKLDIFSPAKIKGKLPAVLMIFGGGWRSGNRTMHWPMAQSIAARGYIVITADYRLSTEALYPAAVNDLKTAVMWLRDKGGRYRIDKDKIAVWGFSAGGQLAVLIGTTPNSPLFPGHPIYRVTSNAVQAIVDVDGTLSFIHPESGEGDDTKRISAATYWFGSDKKTRPDLWRQASPLTHVGKNTPPILFLNSGVDRMHAGRDDFNKKLDSLGIYHQVHTFEGAPHSFNMFDPWFTPTLNYTVAFLDKVLKNK
jgi:pectinesterase